MADTDDTADACPECGHPWFDHDDDGCRVWPMNEGPCTCRAKPPEPEPS